MLNLRHDIRKPRLSRCRFTAGLQPKERTIRIGKLHDELKLPCTCRMCIDNATQLKALQAIRLTPLPEQPGEIIDGEVGVPLPELFVAAAVKVGGLDITSIMHRCEEGLQCSLCPAEIPGLRSLQRRTDLHSEQSEQHCPLEWSGR